MWWDSVYMMLEHLRQLRPVCFSQWFDIREEFDWTRCVGHWLVFSNRTSWLFTLPVVRIRLGNPRRPGRSLVGKFGTSPRSQYKQSPQRQVPHTFQQRMSSESTPVLSHTIIEFKKFMTELERLGDDHPVLKPWMDIGVHWATKYYIQMDDTKAYVVSMCKFLNRRIMSLTI